MKFLDKIFDHIDETEEEISGEDCVAEALQKALDNTTAERPGCPWDNASEEE